MLSQINMKIIWKTKNFFVSLRKTIYIMIVLLAQYLLVGVIISLGIELIVRWTGYEVSHAERLLMIISWPIMAVIFVWNFIKGYLGKD